MELSSHTTPLDPLSPTPKAQPSRGIRWLKRIGWAAVWVVTLVSLAIAYENWRGRQAWAAYVAEAGARGERLDLPSIVPPAIPDEENFAAAPIFRPLFDVKIEEVVENGKPQQGARASDPEGLATLKKIRAIPEGARKPKGSWRDGKSIDLTDVQAIYRSQPEFAKSAPDTKPADAVIVALSKFDREMEAMRGASMRPRARFPLEYEKHLGMNLPHVQVLQSFAEVARLRAVACLARGESNEAFRETQFLLRLADSLKDEPVIISLLVRYALIETAFQPLWEGLVRHQWTEEQLAAFGTQLAPVNLLGHYQLA
ncbi:MAG TPA: hypothetical protein VF614_06495, partial [Chthoniobacteraceae bacterium]